MTSQTVRIMVMAAVAALLTMPATAANQTDTSILPDLPANPAVPQAQGLHFVRIPEGTVLPVVVANDVYTHALRPGDRLLAQTSKDIRLPSGEILQAGTSFFANVRATHPEAMFGPDTRVMKFDRMQLNNGMNFPIKAAVRANNTLVETFVIPPTSDVRIPRGQCLLLEFACPAQVAVTGNMM